MDKKYIENLIEKGEGQDLDFKSRFTNDIGNCVCAFANTNDGTILVGVDNKGAIAGVSKKVEEQIANIIDSCDPPVRAAIETGIVDEKNILVVKVKKSRQVHSWKGKIYVRVGSTNRPLSMQEILELGQKLGKIRFDDQICENATIDDIDDKKLRWFLRMAKSERNVDADPETPITEALERLKLIKDGKLTNASILLFGKNPQKFFLQARIRCARFKGTTAVDFIDMKLIDGNIIDQVDKAENFVLSHIKKAAKIVMFKREEVWEYPPDALREAIVNAVCHRDYFISGNIKIAIFDDRIEISNPGQLPEPLTPSMLKKKHDSIPRNLLIANCFFLIKNIEQWGIGTNKIVQWCVEHGLKEPDFEEIGAGFEVIFYASEDILKLIPEKGKVDLKELRLNERQIEALRLMINENQEITNKKYRHLFGVSDRTASRELKFLIEKGLIKRSGKRRGATYVSK